MLEDEQAFYRAILRDDLEAFIQKTFQILSPGQTFVPGWHISAIAYLLDQIRRGETKRAILNLPPRSLKSITASVAFPAFVLGHDPTRRIICASYSADLAFKHSNDFRAVINTPWYRELFPAMRISSDKDTEAEITTTQRGMRLATSVGGTLTGRGGDMAIIDDPLKPQDANSDPKRTIVNQWFSNTLLSRLDNKLTGSILIIMQRLHMDDLSGTMLRQSADWTHLNLSAIAERDEEIPIGPGRFYRRAAGEALCPTREPVKVLRNLQRELGSDLFSAQYQQAPVPPGGAMIKRSWVRQYTELPPEERRLMIIQSWDTAAKGGPDNDWSVCTTWLQTNDCQFYLLDVWRRRVDYPTLKACVQELAHQWGANQILIEEAGTAIGLIDELRYCVFGLTGIKPTRDKVSRMSQASALIEAGQVHFPLHAPWLPELEAELFAFPGSHHDDQVDSISQALLHANSSLSVWARLASY